MVVNAAPPRLAAGKRSATLNHHDRVFTAGEDGNDGGARVIEDPPELVAMRLALGQQLAALREAAEIVQQQIGHKAERRADSISTWIRNHHLIREARKRS